MGQFEYLSVLISIILGLGITQLLTGFGRWLERRTTFRAYGPAIIWATILLIVHIQTWWSMFGMRDWSAWNFVQFAVVLLQPIILFLLAILAFPGPGGTDDLRENYFAQQRWFFGLFMMLLVVSVLKDLARTGSLPDPMNLVFHGIFFLLSVMTFISRRDVIHHILAATGLVLVSGYILLLFGQLGA